MTPFEIAQRFVGELAEIPGEDAHPMIMAMLRLDGNEWTEKHGDETPWCSAFVNWCAWMARCPRSKSLLARSWLTVGVEMPGFGTVNAQVGEDVVILQRGGGDQPDASDLTAPGHVGFYAGYQPKGKSVLVLGGNQGNNVSVLPYPVERVLGVRRLREGM